MIANTNIAYVRWVYRLSTAFARNVCIHCIWYHLARSKVRLSEKLISGFYASLHKSLRRALIAANNWCLRSLNSSGSAISTSVESNETYSHPTNKLCGVRVFIGKSIYLVQKYLYFNFAFTYNLRPILISVARLYVYESIWVCWGCRYRRHCTWWQAFIFITV